MINVFTYLIYICRKNESIIILLLYYINLFISLLLYFLYTNYWYIFQTINNIENFTNIYIILNLKIVNKLIKFMNLLCILFNFKLYIINIILYR